MSSYQMKTLLYSNLSAYKKIVDSVLTQRRKIVEGYTPGERLAYIVNLKDYNINKEMIHIFNQINMGRMTITSKEFENFLYKHSENDDDWSESGSCVEELEIE